MSINTPPVSGSIEEDAPNNDSVKPEMQHKFDPEQIGTEQMESEQIDSHQIDSKNEENIRNIQQKFDKLLLGLEHFEFKEKNAKGGGQQEEQKYQQQERQPKQMGKEQMLITINNDMFKYAL
jgi:hypothetical protein